MQRESNVCFFHILCAHFFQLSTLCHPPPCGKRWGSNTLGPLFFLGKKFVGDKQVMIVVQKVLEALSEFKFVDWSVSCCSPFFANHFVCDLPQVFKAEADNLTLAEHRWELERVEEWSGGSPGGGGQPKHGTQQTRVQCVKARVCGSLKARNNGEMHQFFFAEEIYSPQSLPRHFTLSPTSLNHSTCHEPRQIS